MTSTAPPPSFLVHKVRQQAESAHYARLNPAASAPAPPVRKAGKWEAHKHPRDKKGRFIRIGASITVAGLKGNLTVTGLELDGVHAKDSKGNEVTIADPKTISEATPRPKGFVPEKVLTREDGEHLIDGLGAARAKWVRRVGEQMLPHMAEDDPERAFWEGVTGSPATASTPAVPAVPEPAVPNVPSPPNAPDLQPDPAYPLGGPKVAYPGLRVRQPSKGDRKGTVLDPPTGPRKDGELGVQVLWDDGTKTNSFASSLYPVLVAPTPRPATVAPEPEVQGYGQDFIGAGPHVVDAKIELPDPTEVRTAKAHYEALQAAIKLDPGTKKKPTDLSAYDPHRLDGPDAAKQRIQPRGLEELYVQDIPLAGGKYPIHFQKDRAYVVYGPDRAPYGNLAYNHSSGEWELERFDGRQFSTTNMSAQPDSENDTSYVHDLLKEALANPPGRFAKLPTRDDIVIPGMTAMGPSSKYDMKSEVKFKGSGEVYGTLGSLPDGGYEFVRRDDGKVFTFDESDVLAMGFDGVVETTLDEKTRDRGKGTTAHMKIGPDDEYFIGDSYSSASHGSVSDVTNADGELYGQISYRSSGALMFTRASDGREFVDDTPPGTPNTTRYKAMVDRAIDSPPVIDDEPEDVPGRLPLGHRVGITQELIYDMARGRDRVPATTVKTNAEIQDELEQEGLTPTLQSFIDKEPLSYTVKGYDYYSHWEDNEGNFHDFFENDPNFKVQKVGGSYKRRLIANFPGDASNEGILKRKKALQRLSYMGNDPSQVGTGKHLSEELKKNPDLTFEQYFAANDKLGTYNLADWENGGDTYAALSIKADRKKAAQKKWEARLQTLINQRRKKTGAVATPFKDIPHWQDVKFEKQTYEDVARHIDEAAPGSFVPTFHTSGMVEDGVLYHRRGSAGTPREARVLPMKPGDTMELNGYKYEWTGELNALGQYKVKESFIHADGTTSYEQQVHWTPEVAAQRWGIDFKDQPIQVGGTYVDASGNGQWWQVVSQEGDTYKVKQVSHVIGAEPEDWVKDQHEGNFVGDAEFEVTQHQLGNRVDKREPIPSVTGGRVTTNADSAAVAALTRAGAVEMRNTKNIDPGYRGSGNIYAGKMLFIGDMDTKDEAEVTPRAAKMARKEIGDSDYYFEINPASLDLIEEAKSRAELEDALNSIGVRRKNQNYRSWQWEPGEQVELTEPYFMSEYVSNPTPEQLAQGVVAGYNTASLGAGDKFEVIYAPPGQPSMRVRVNGVDVSIPKSNFKPPTELEWTKVGDLTDYNGYSLKDRIQKAKNRLQDFYAPEPVRGGKRIEYVPHSQPMQGAPTSQRGRLTLEGYTPDEAAEKLRELGIVGDLEPEVPYEQVFRSKRREGLVLPLHRDYISGDAELPKMHHYLTHGLTDTSAGQKGLEGKLQSIFGGGGLHSIAERYRRGIKATTASPAGDIRSGIDHVVFVGHDHSGAVGAGARVQIALKPEALLRRNIVMAPKDFGGMDTRYQMYKDYLNSLQRRAKEDETSLYASPSPKIRQYHLNARKKSGGTAEFNIGGSIPVEDMAFIGVNNEKDRDSVMRILQEQFDQGKISEIPDVIMKSEFNQRLTI